jgi:hypothetical protein
VRCAADARTDTRRSCFLLGLFLLFKFLPKDLINTVLTGYFVVLVCIVEGEMSRLRPPNLCRPCRVTGRHRAGRDERALCGAAASAAPEAPHGTWRCAAAAVASL